MKYVRRIFLLFMVLFPVTVWAGIQVISIQQAQTIQNENSIDKQDLETIDFLFVRPKSVNFMSHPPKPMSK